MRIRLSLGLLMLSGVIWAQQTAAPQPGSSQPSSSQAGSPQTGSPQTGTSQPNAPQSPPSKTNAAQPPAKPLSDDLTFPESDPAETAPPAPAPKSSHMTPPRSDRVSVDDLGPGVGESSSKDSKVDLTPPADDTKAHPQSSAAVAEAEAGLTPRGITELHSWDPHKAAKSVEVGDFYFRRKNYRAAADRYREALQYKNNDAVATLRLATSLEKLKLWDDARAEYESYLRILPYGAEAGEARKGIERMNVQIAGPNQTQSSPQSNSADPNHPH